MTVLIVILAIIGLLLVWSFWGLLKDLILFIATFIYHGMIAIYMKFFVINPMLNTEWAKQKSIELHRIDAKKRFEKENEDLAERERIEQAGSIQVKNMRVKFPYAAEDLFEKYLNRFPYAMPEELSQLEMKIQKSHSLNKG